MQLNILIVGVLFPAIPLMMINFGNRYSLLAGLIRSLHDTVINVQTHADDSAPFFQENCQPAPTLAPARCDSDFFYYCFYSEFVSDDFAVSEHR